MLLRYVAIGDAAFQRCSQTVYMFGRLQAWEESSKQLGCDMVPANFRENLTVSASQGSQELREMECFTCLAKNG